MRGPTIAFLTLVLLSLGALHGSSFTLGGSVPPREANRTILLQDLPSYVPTDPAGSWNGVSEASMTAAQALEAHLDFLAANGIDLRQQAEPVLPNEFPLVGMVRVTETGDIRFATAGNPPLKCPSLAPLEEPLPTVYNTVWPAAFPNIPADVRDTLLLSADSKAQTATSQVSYYQNPNGNGGSASEYVPGTSDSDPVDLERTLTYHDKTITMGPVSKVKCTPFYDAAGAVKAVIVTAITHGVVDEA